MRKEQYIVVDAPYYPTLEDRMKAAEWLADGGFKLANNGHDTRAIQHYLGHRSIQPTVRYAELAPDRFKGFWQE